MEPLTFGSLFAGIGGFDLGFERAGMVCKWQVEIDDYARRVLAKHWPDVRRWDDVRTFQPTEGFETVDVICGGDPCQENSLARQTDNCNDPSLGDQFIRVVNAFRPRIVVRENPAMLRADAPWPWQRFRSELESIGYAVLPFRLRACCFGADHQRDRMFLLAELADALKVGCDQRCEAIFEQWSNSHRPRPDVKRRSRWPTDAGICRVANGIPDRMDRVRTLGNAVVPQVAEWIGRRIVEAVKEATESKGE